MLVFASFAFGQGDGEPKERVPEYPEHIRSSPAFAEVILRKAILESELEEMLVRYTNQYPKVAEARFEMAQLELAIGKLLDVPPAESSKLTLALGKLLVQRAAFATDLDVLKRKYNDDHPEVKRAAKKLEIFDKSIERIL